MPLDFWISIGCLGLAIVLMTLLMRYNLKVLRETKQERLEIRRAYKRIKNARLAKQFGIKLKNYSDKP